MTLDDSRALEGGAMLLHYRNPKNAGNRSDGR